MEKDFTLREKHLARAVRQRVLVDYQFDLTEEELRFVLGDRSFSLTRGYVTESLRYGPSRGYGRPGAHLDYTHGAERHAPDFREDSGWKLVASLGLVRNIDGHACYRLALACFNYQSQCVLAIH